MFFTVSKIVWLFAAPSNLILLALVSGAALAWFNRPRAGRAISGLGILGFIVCGPGPLGPLLTTLLEDRFQRPGADMAAPDGIIVLGGAMDEALFTARGALVLGPSGTRMTEGMALARRFPDAKFVFTGGGPYFTAGASEAAIARRLFEAQGLPAEKFIYEDRSRNTWENAIFTRDIVKPQPGERWLLVTSATHMPRSMGIFRNVGFNVTAWPAHYLTTGGVGAALRPNFETSGGLQLVDVATKEWVGLVAYRLTGKTNALCPAP